MPEKRWKSTERRVAKSFGTTRTGPTGKDDNDVFHPLLAIEIKNRAKLPRWALDCLAQARAGRTAGGKIPVVILLGKYMRLGDGLLVLRLADFQDLFGKVTVVEPEEMP